MTKLNQVHHPKTVRLSVLSLCLVLCSSCEPFKSKCLQDTSSPRSIRSNKESFLKPISQKMTIESRFELFIFLRCHSVCHKYLLIPLEANQIAPNAENGAIGELSSFNQWPRQAITLDYMVVPHRANLHGKAIQLAKHSIMQMAALNEAGENRGAENPITRRQQFSALLPASFLLFLDNDSFSARIVRVSCDATIGNLDR